MASLIKRGGVLQRWLFGLFRLGLRKVREPGQALARAQRIALLRFDKRLGEVLLQTPLFAALRAAFPEAELIAVTHPRFAQLLTGQPHINSVQSLNMRGFPFSLTAWRGLMALRASRVDLAIDCANYNVLSTGQAIATLFSGAAQRVGFDRGQDHETLIYSTVVSPLENDASERRQRLHLLSALGHDVDLNTPLRYHPRQSQSPEVLSLLAEMKNSPFVVINPGGRLAWRRVSPEIFAAAGQALLDRQLRPLVVWGPDEKDLAMSLCINMGPRARLAPPTSVDDLALVMTNAKATISNNSGPMHLAIAVGSPTLGVFLDMPSDRWGETRPPHAVVDLSGDADPEQRLQAAVGKFVDDLAVDPHSQAAPEPYSGDQTT